MISTDGKKIIILRILTILEQFSDSEHFLTHNKILELLKKEYNIECERKAIGRNILFLKDGGYPIISSRKGVYLESRLFEKSELRLLIDSVLASRHINENHSKQLIKKLCSLGGIYFNNSYKNIRIAGWGKSHNNSFFYNVEIIDEAIEKSRQIEFIYNYYDKDKKLHPKKDHKYLINPYQMLLHNQRYYLLGNVDKYDEVSYYRIERITGISILETPSKSIKTLPNHTEGLNLAKIPCEHPYMFTGDDCEVVLELNKSLIGDIIDWFGDNFIIDELSENRINVTFKVNFQAMRYWAMQYGTNVEIIKPLNLRETIKADLKTMVEKYGE